ncbi:MAG: aminoacetone oxidase family FAD-binding enzyme [Burkholderiaceae bacterium]|jgi:predicted Rossmann fold flavoprotein
MSRASFDVAVIGAGAAGMMCAAVAAQRGRSVVLVDHWARPAEKVRISGGGRCNFTNVLTAAEHFISSDPEFCRPALAAYGPSDFIALVKRHRIGYHEKHRGQLFCDDTSEAIITMLKTECARAAVLWRVPEAVTEVSATSPGYRLTTEKGSFAARSVVIATGGLSIPKIGATDFGYRIARQFGLSVIEPRAALVPLTFPPAPWAPYAALAGVALPVRIESVSETPDHGRSVAFDEDLLFTHRGLSGPAILQISSYWNPGDALVIDLSAGVALGKALIEEKATSRRDLGPVLTQWLPKRLVENWTTTQIPEGGALLKRRMAEIPNKSLEELARLLKGWRLVPSGTEGFRKAEVTRGGVDTRFLSPTTMEVRDQPGLYFVGEVVDVTGWLGGYNFQWAWASAVAAGRAV